MENITLVLIIVFMALAIGLLITFYFKNQKTENIENAFKVIAAQVLEEKNSSLTKENIERVNVVLEPFKEQIKELNHQISDLKKEQAVAHKIHFHSVETSSNVDINQLDSIQHHPRPTCLLKKKKLPLIPQEIKHHEV